MRRPAAISALPIEWEGNLMLTDSTDEEDAVELRTVDENKLVLTCGWLRSSENAVGWTRLVWWRPARCRQSSARM